MKSLLSKIENNYKHFSKGQKLVANYILKNYDKAAFMTASKLGKTAGVSESTVVRFATELGYKGYPELQKSIQQMIKSRLTSVQRIEVTSNRIGNSDILNSVLAQDIDNIRQTLCEIPHDDFYKAVDYLLLSKRIYILAARSSLPIASSLYYYLNLIFDNVRLVKTKSETEIYEKMLSVNETDVVVGISFPRYSKQVVKAVNFSADQGAKIIAITDSMSSPIIRFSDCSLLAKSDMVSIVDSLTAPLSLINALIVAIALKKKDDVSNRLKTLENIWEKYEVYEKIEGDINEF